VVEIGSRCTQLCYVVAHLVSRAIGSDEFNADQLVAVELIIKIGGKLEISRMLDVYGQDFPRLKQTGLHFILMKNCERVMRKQVTAPMRSTQNFYGLHIQRLLAGVAERVMKMPECWPDHLLHQWDV